MYEKDGEKYFVVDGHIHLWDGSPANQKNEYGKGFINCFYDYHKNLSPAEYVWSFEEYAKYAPERLVRDLFVDGHVDVGIFLPTILGDFYVNGFFREAETAALVDAYPGRFVLNGSFDPREKEAGLEMLAAAKEKYGIPGVKLYTAEWKGDSRGYKLTDPWSERYLARCEELGITNIHIHKGPTIWPLDRDAFDVADIDHVATNFPNLNFIVEHVGLPRLEDFCWIGTQEPNVYGGLAVAMPFIYTRPRYFAQVMGELLYWLGEDRLFFASDYALWHPKWLVEMFVDFQIPEDMQAEYGEITIAAKKKVLGLNAARLYGLEVPAECRLPEDESAAAETVPVTAGPDASVLEPV